MNTAVLERLDAISVTDPGGEAALGEDTLGALRLQRAWPRGPDHLLLEYATADGRRLPAQWFGRPDGTPDRDRLEHVAAATTRAGAGHGTAVVDDAHGVLLHHNGADRRLRGLAGLAGRAGADVVVHRPERRAVVRLTELVETRYVKIVRPAAIGSLVAAAAHAGGAADVAVPTLLHVDADRGWTTWSALPGASLHELAGAPRRGDAVGRPGAPGYVQAAGMAGQALRALHALPARPDLPVHDGRHEADVVTQWLTRSGPYLASRLSAVPDAVCDQVRIAVSGGAGPHVVIHRDFHDKNVLIADGRRVGMLDIDTLSTGEAALDLANVLVHLHLRALQGLVPPATAAQAATALLDGYQPDPAVTSRLDAYADATRLRLACVYGFRPANTGCSEALLATIGAPTPGTR